jgi:hypothetical protein
MAKQAEESKKKTEEVMVNITEELKTAEGRLLEMFSKIRITSSLEQTRNPTADAAVQADIDEPATEEVKDNYSEQYTCD